MALRTRLDLQSLLESIDGVKKVYFQPPTGLMLEYPCIVYSRSNILTRHADNNPHITFDRYTVTAIYRDPDSRITKHISQIPSCRHDRAFKKDNLNHDTFTISF